MYVPEILCAMCGGSDPMRLLEGESAARIPPPVEASGRKKPTLARMARDFAAAMKAAAADGFQRVSEAEYLERRRLCSDCSGGWRCPECGCVIRLKATMRAWHCPRGIW